MTNPKSFKERVKEELIINAQIYQNIFLNYQYLVFSKHFTTRKYYIISAEKDNFLHLTGVNSKLKASDFFDKCINETLNETDFNFIKKGQNEKNIKGTVRRKIKAFSNIANLITNKATVEENFTKNNISCSLATTDNSCTLGFTNTKSIRPKSLMNGNQTTNPYPIDILLRKPKSEILSYLARRLPLLK